MGRKSLSLILLLAAPRIARADPVPVDDRFEALYPKPKPAAVHLSHVKWYGWQIIALDVPLLAFFATWPAWQFEGTAPLILDAIAFTAIGPIVHGAHDDGPGAGGSFGLRAGFLAVGATVGAVSDLGCGLSLGRCSSPRPGFDAWAGSLATMTFASLVDCLALTWEKSPDARNVSWGIAPTFLPGGSGVSLRVGY